MEHPDPRGEVVEPGPGEDAVGGVPGTGGLDADEPGGRQLLHDGRRELVLRHGIGRGRGMVGLVPGGALEGVDEDGPGRRRQGVPLRIPFGQPLAPEGPLVEVAGLAALLPAPRPVPAHDPPPFAPDVRSRKMVGQSPPLDPGPRHGFSPGLPGKSRTNPAAARHDRVRTRRPVMDPTDGKGPTRRRPPGRPDAVRGGDVRRADGRAIAGGVPRSGRRGA